MAEFFRIQDGIDVEDVLPIGADRDSGQKLAVNDRGKVRLSVDGNDTKLDPVSGILSLLIREI